MEFYIELMRQPFPWKQPFHWKQLETTLKSTLESTQETTLESSLESTLTTTLSWNKHIPGSNEDNPQYIYINRRHPNRCLSVLLLTNHDASTTSIFTSHTSRDVSITRISSGTSNYGEQHILCYHYTNHIGYSVGFSCRIFIFCRYRWRKSISQPRSPNMIYELFEPENVIYDRTRKGTWRSEIFLWSKCSLCTISKKILNIVIKLRWIFVFTLHFRYFNIYHSILDHDHFIIIIIIIFIIRRHCRRE